MSVITSPDVIVVCPYDHSHSIILSRLQTHLCKCSKNNADAGMVTCPFNSAHHINKSELMTHVNNLCPDRIKVDLAMFRNETHAEQIVPVKEVVVDIKLSENWDDEYFETYDPQKTCVNKPILRYYQGGTPSQRKLFRMAERQRLNGFLDPTENNGDFSEKKIDKDEDFVTNNVSKKMEFEIKESKETLKNIQEKTIPVEDMIRSFNKCQFSSDEGFVKVATKGRGRGRFLKKK